MILTEYNEALHMENEKKLSFEQGLEQGLNQGIEQGLTQGIEQGLAQGIEQGLTQGLEQGLRAFILDKLEDKVPRQQILEKIMSRFNLSEEEATEQLKPYEAGAK